MKICIWRQIVRLTVLPAASKMITRCLFYAVIALHCSIEAVALSNEMFYRYCGVDNFTWFSEIRCTRWWLLRLTVDRWWGASEQKFFFDL